MDAVVGTANGRPFVTFIYGRGRRIAVPTIFFPLHNGFLPKRNTSGEKRAGKRKPQQKPAFPSIFPHPYLSPFAGFCFCSDTQAKGGCRTGSMNAAARFCRAVGAHSVRPLLLTVRISNPSPSGDTIIIHYS